MLSHKKHISLFIIHVRTSTEYIFLCNACSAVFIRLMPVAQTYKGISLCVIRGVSDEEMFT